jgi:[acyl-carrier-protein] S-malonyltransferase
MRRIALTFSGQGSQRPGMGRAWAGSPGWSLIDEAVEITGVDVAWLLLDADEATLRETAAAQLATLVLELVVLAEVERIAPALMPMGVAAAGHSLGEYAALSAAGVISPATAIELVRVRGRAMRAACRQEPGSMVVVLGLDLGTVNGLVTRLQEDGARVWVANINGTGQVAGSGDLAGVERLSRAAEAAGAASATRVRVIRIPVGGAFHTPLMRVAETELETAIRAAEFAPGRIPVVANVDAEPHRSAPEWRELLVRQLTSPVRWHDSLLTLCGPLDCDLLIEIGPARVLTGLARASVPATERISISEPKDLEVLARALTGRRSAELLRPQV